MKPLFDAIEAGELALAAEADALVERVARGSAAPLDAAGRRKRAADLRTGLAGLKASVEEAPQIGDAVAFAAKVSEIATPAANLRARVLELLGAGPPANATADWKLIGKGSLGVRTLVGREGAKIAVRRQDGRAETWDADEVSAQTIADCARVLGEPPAPLSVALLEFWDGEDDAAQARLKGMAGEPVRDWMLGLVGASIETAASSYPTEAEREAFPLFLQARRRQAEGAHARALELVGPMLTQKRLVGTAFLRQHREEIERIAAHSKAMLARSGRLRPFGPAAEIKDERAGRVRLAWTFGEGKPVDGLSLPPGSEQVEAGLKWPGQAGDRAVVPEQAPALRIEFAEGVPAAPVVVEVEVLRSPEPVAFIALSFGGYTLLALGDLRQSRAFAGVPLHGLERDLVQVQSVQKAILVAGSLADARRLVGPSGRPAALNRAESTTVRFWIDPERAEIFGMVGSEKIPVFGDRRNPTEPPALDLRLSPGVVVRSLSVELPLVPR